MINVNTLYLFKQLSPTINKEEYEKKNNLKM